MTDDTLRIRPQGLLDYLRGEQSDDPASAEIFGAWADWVERQIFPSSNPEPPARWHGGGSGHSLTFWRSYPTPAVVNARVNPDAKTMIFTAARVSPAVYGIISQAVSENIWSDNLASKIETTLDAIVNAQDPEQTPEPPSQGEPRST